MAVVAVAEETTTIIMTTAEGLLATEIKNIDFAFF
jgi:hypothetical protein